MSSLFVKGVILKSGDHEVCSYERLKQRRKGDICRLPYMKWSGRGNLSVPRRELRLGASVKAVLNPVSPPPAATTTKKRLKQRRKGDICRLPYMKWSGRGNLSVPRRELRLGASVKAVLNPVSPPPAATTTKKRVFTFGKGKSEGNKGMKSLLGGKGANLAEMASIGLSVPPGLTISTEACNEYVQGGKKLPSGLWDEILEGLQYVQTEIGASLGDPTKPLLLSVRSGAAISMPGMMDTVLNLGLNDEVVAGLAGKSGARFAYDSYRRFLDMFGNVVMDIPHALFEERLGQLKAERGVHLDTDLTAADLKDLVEQYKKVYVEYKGEKFPTDPKKQLELAVNAVFDSWDSPRANKYRSINQITGLKGTAVNIQCMVFGNMGDTSGTGVLFTRNPSTGENKLYGEFLINAQGEDVVAGIRTPQDIVTMKNCMPEAYKELVENCEILERHYKDMMVGICGEHGGEPSSVAFFDGAGLDYVSCSPFRVPIARLAAAQVAVQAS
ncbi:pyruvate, phosphate dikinase [Artemisia annua]|uniref:Pyruvate, phosphate dikinase n=1 Tax=Artemisia annua TaxID=35608 RepID=A0A2U1QDL6_ARTAN|nr:pyruvate, phosphate dikinase [Artemisia annua]